MSNPNRTVSVCVMSGKGGVGKTNLALNLGYALHLAGHSSLLMDCDLGLANLDVLLGLTPEKNLQDLLTEGTSARDVVASIEPGGLDVLPAASGVPELVEMNEDMRETLMSKLLEMVGAYRFLLLDLGAGISSTVLSFATLAQLRLVIVTPEPTSLTDSYALIKVLNSQYGVEDFCVCVNMASSAKEAALTFQRLDQACKNFLGFSLTNLGYVRQDPKLVEAVRKQKPLMKLSPRSVAALDIQALADKFIRYRTENREVLAERPPLRQFPVR